MIWEDVEARLNRTKNEFLRRDRYLLQICANERSMTHKFAEYLQIEFPDWHVDCEFNRKGNARKVLRWARVPSDDEKAKTVFPDIIVHRRGGPVNLLVIEAKKSGGDDADDRAKLDSFMNGDYEYQYAVFLRFVTQGEGDIDFFLVREKIAGSDTARQDALR